MNKLTVIELLDGLISDLKDYISDYEDDIKSERSRLEVYEKRIRIDEMRKWMETLKTIRMEQSNDNCS